MKKLRFIFSFAAMCVAVSAVSSQSFNVRSPAFSPSFNGKYIVVLDDSPESNTSNSLSVNYQSADLASTYGFVPGQILRSSITGFVAAMSAEQAQALSTDARVKMVEPDRPISISSQQANAPWNLDRVDQRNMPWDTIYDYSAMGAGVHVYILDTGIRVTHQEFGGRASVAYDAIGDGQNGNDCNGHGTHVAGIVGGSTYGVAKGSSLHAVRVIPCSGTGSLSTLLMGIEWVTANHLGPAVANISAAAIGQSFSLEMAINNSIASGVVYTIAAGNNAADSCGFTPARTPNAITVAASDETDRRALYSNYGTCVDLFAPGNAVVSAYAGSDTATRELSGSSMAAPMAAGVAALYYGSNPTSTASNVIQAVKGTSTANVLNVDSTSPNLLLYSRLALSPTAGTVAVSGRVVNAAGRGIHGVIITLTDPSNGSISSSRTNQFGAFQIAGVTTGRSYVITALPPRQFTMTENSRQITVTESISGLQFIAETYQH
jgi:subtilisin family serine protease